MKKQGSQKSLKKKTAQFLSDNKVPSRTEKISLRINKNKDFFHYRHRASAGGLDAFEHFFKGYMPSDSGMAFVLITAIVLFF